MGGSARKPNSGHWKNKFEIDDLNKFHSGKRIYIRTPKRSDVPALPTASKPEVAVNVAVPDTPAPILQAVGTGPLVNEKPPTAIFPKPTVDPKPAVAIDAKPEVAVLPKPTVPVAAAGPYVFYYQNYFVGHWNAVGYHCTK